MTPFASVFQRMLWLVLVSFLSDYKTLPAFHLSEHTQVNEDEKKVHQISSLCPEFVPPTVFTAMRKRPTLDFLSKTWYSPCLYAMCPYVCTARDFAPAFRSFLLVPVCVLQVILSLLYVPVTCPWGCTARDFASALRSCHLSLRVYCTWFCLCFTLLSLVPEGVLHVILPLLYAPVTCPWGCTARDFAPALRYCHLSLRVYCTWFFLCFTLLSLVPECVLRVISPLLYVPVALSVCVYCTWFCPLLYVPVACPCVCTARDFVANTHCFDMSLQHEPSFFLVSTKPLWHHLISFFGPF